MSKAISILIPAYNAAKFIGVCLQSVACQTFTDYEVIVSNDGSTDTTASEVKDFKAANPGLDIKIVSAENGGVSLARKRALENATGEWVVFLDADDTLPSNSLADLYEQAGDDTDLVVGFITPPRIKPSCLNLPNEWQSAVIQGVIPPPIGGKLYRRAVLKPSMLEIPRRITNGEDALMNIAFVFAMSKPPKFTYANIYNYTRQPLSLSHTTKRDLEYEYFYDSFRLKAIPETKHLEYMNGITKYRLNGLLGCSRSDSETIASKQHPFFKVINEGILQCGYRLSPFEWIALKVKSPFIIRKAGLLRLVFISLNYRLSLLLKK